MITGSDATSPADPAPTRELHPDTVALLALAEIVVRYLAALDDTRVRRQSARAQVRLTEAEDLLRRAVTP